MTNVQRHEARAAAITHVTEVAASRAPVFAEDTCRRLEQEVAAWTDEAMVERVRRSWAEDAFGKELAALQAKINTIEHLWAGGLTKRPPRQMPRLPTIAAVHELGDLARCVRCSYLPPVDEWRYAHSYLQRAHIIDRVFDGTDYPANLAPLCEGCHGRQPIFQPGDEAVAYTWFGLRDPLRAARV